MASCVTVSLKCYSILRCKCKLTGLEQPLHKWSGIFTREVHAKTGVPIPQKILKCALSEIESGHFHVPNKPTYVTVKQHFLLNYCAC